MVPAILALFTFLPVPADAGRDRILPLLQAGDFEAAAASMEKILADQQRGVERGEVALLLSQCYLEMRLPVKAARALSLCPKGWKKDPRYLYCMAESLAARGDSLEAENLLRSIPADSIDLRGVFRLAVLLYERGEHLGVVELLAAAAAGEPPDYYSCIYRARSLLALNRPADAMAALQAIRKVQDTPEIQYLLGRCAYSLRNYPQAAGHFRLALKEDKAYLEASFSLSEVLRRAGDREGAKAALVRFAQLQKVERVRSRRANLLSQRCRREPGSLAAWLEAGEFHLGDGDSDQAISHAWQALQLEPGKIPARLLLARALRDSGQYSQAALHYRKVIIREPGHDSAAEELREMIRKHAQK